MRHVLDRLAGRLGRRPAVRASAQPPSPASPSIERREQMAALIRRDYPFMSEDCIRQVLDEM